jgi:hypothetical protein
MNISPNEFWDMTMREYVLKQRGYISAIEDEQIHDWNVMRVLACYVLKPHLKKGAKLKPQELMQLPIDKTKKQFDLEKAKKEAILFDMKVKKYEKNNKNKEQKKVNVAELLVKNKKK